MAPSSNWFNPLRHLNKVDLPPPDGPSSATVSPGFTFTLTRSSTRRVPKRLVTSLTAMAKDTSASSFPARFEIARQIAERHGHDEVQRCRGQTDLQIAA